MPEFTTLRIRAQGTSGAITAVMLVKIRRVRYRQKLSFCKESKVAELESQSTQ
jgi:hypothetical protein